MLEPTWANGSILVSLTSGGDILTSKDAVIFQSGIRHAMERQRKLVIEQLFSE